MFKPGTKIIQLLTSEKAIREKKSVKAWVPIAGEHEQAMGEEEKGSIGGSDYESFWFEWWVWRLETLSLTSMA